MDTSITDALTDLRPRLHRYCARMLGSAFDGEDAVQTTLLRALQDGGAGVTRLEPWAFRIAHNICIDMLRGRRRAALVPLPDDLAAPEVARLSFRSFLTLTPTQRAAVILKDVLGHSVAEIADLTNTSPAATKSALQRGRAALRQVADAPPPAPADQARMGAFIDHFRAGDFDAVRAMLAEDVRLDLVNRLALAGKAAITPYFTRYAEATHWRFAPLMVEGRAAMQVLDGQRASHIVVLDWHQGQITAIRDSLFAPYLSVALCLSGG